MQLITIPITLVDSFMITPKVKHFIFKAETTPVFNYEPGQFITIHFEHEGKPLKRSYSIANPPSGTNTIEFSAGYFDGGPGTDLLFNLTPGDIIHINGPFGRLVLKDEVPGRYIFVATSTGITPFRAMLAKLTKLLQEYPSNLKIVILQGVQKREEILFATDFQHFAQQHPQVRFIPCLSREEDSVLTENEFSGYVQQVFPQLNLDPAQDLVYLCGNPGMIDDAFNYLKDQGFAMQQIIREKYISR